VPTTPIAPPAVTGGTEIVLIGGERILIGADGRRTPAWYLAGTSSA
jgi:hypothetical protein